MEIITYFGEIKKSPSIFLAGPTNRDLDIQRRTSWRIDALNFLKENGFKGIVYTPEFFDDIREYSENIQPDQNKKTKFIDICEWEEEALNAATVILFWVPRTQDDMLALTTNDEFGTWKYSGKCVFGAPEDAWRVRYQLYYAEKLGIPYSRDLKETVSLAIQLVEKLKEI